MGMFDDLWVAPEIDLPGYDDGAREFQTKDLECLMEHYQIRADRKLWKQAFDIVEVRDEPDSFAGFYVHYDGEYWVNMEHHGPIRFYDGSHEYIAKFTDGLLVSIERVDEEADLIRGREAADKARQERTRFNPRNPS